MGEDPGEADNDAGLEAELLALMGGEEPSPVGNRRQKAGELSGLKYLWGSSRIPSQRLIFLSHISQHP